MGINRKIRFNIEGSGWIGPQGGRVSHRTDSSSSSAEFRNLARRIKGDVLTSVSAVAAHTTAPDDLHSFRTAVRGVNQAVLDQVISKQEGDSLLRMLIERWAARRVDLAVWGVTQRMILEYWTSSIAENK